MLIVSGTIFPTNSVRTSQRLKMEDNLPSLSNHLSQASSIIPSLLEENQPSVAATPGTSRNVGDVSSTLNRARAILNTSISRGNFTRLNRRERLRSQATDLQPTSEKKRKVRIEKTFEFVLVDVDSEEDNWAISNDIVLLRGLVDISTDSKEDDIRKEIGNAVRLKFPAVNDTDFEFLRATRRKLSKPVNCRGYDFKQLKVITGQGAIYAPISGFPLGLTHGLTREIAGRI